MKKVIKKTTLRSRPKAKHKSKIGGNLGKSHLTRQERQVSEKNVQSTSSSKQQMKCSESVSGTDRQPDRQYVTVKGAEVILTDRQYLLQYSANYIEVHRKFSENNMFFNLG